MAQHDAHTLPAEIIFMISAAASTNDLRTATKLCLVCHATRGWVLPVMYGSVVLTTARDIETLAAALTRLTTDAPTLEHPASRIRRLWIGPTWTPSPQKAHPSESSSLQTLSSHTAWPSPSIRAILSLATNLDALAVLAAPSSFSLATLSVPKTVRALTLGPAHGPLNLNRFPHIRSVTSVNTMVFEDELRAILFGDRRSAARRRVRMVVRGAEVGELVRRHVGNVLEQLNSSLEVGEDEAAGVEVVLCVPRSPAAERPPRRGKEGREGGPMPRGLTTAEWRSVDDAWDSQPDIVATVFARWSRPRRDPSTCS